MNGLGSMPLCKVGHIFLIDEMAGIKVDIDKGDFEEKLQSLSSRLSKKEMARAVYLGINKTATEVRTVTAREIRQIYNIRYSFLTGKYIKIEKANFGKMQATIALSQRPIPMGEFLKSKANKRGVSIEIKKGKLIRGAFLFRSKFGETKYPAIMHRSYVTGKSSYSNSFQFRHKRISSGKDLPIGAIFSVSPFSTVFNRMVNENIGRIGGEKLQYNVFKTLDAMADGLIQNARNRGARR